MEYAFRIVIGTAVLAYMAYCWITVWRWHRKYQALMRSCRELQDEIRDRLSKEPTAPKPVDEA